MRISRDMLPSVILGAALPYLPPPKIVVGSATLHLFGFLVGIAAALGWQLVMKRARARDLSERTMRWLLVWVMFGGFVGGHVIDLVLYEPRVVLTEPLRVFRIWESLGSFGGFAGAAIGALVYFHVAKVENRLEYADAFGWAFPVSWSLGRIGCALAYDHVGRPTSFFLGQRWLDGQVHHNLGLEEALFSCVLATTMIWVGRKRRPPGSLVGLMLLAYAPFRFLLDELRIEDARYLGRTPAQYGAIVLGLGGVALLLSSSRPAATTRA